jgi:hypothetical protein
MFPFKKKNKKIGKHAVGENVTIYCINVLSYVSATKNFFAIYGRWTSLCYLYPVSLSHTQHFEF